jgi:alanine transaminase
MSSKPEPLDVASLNANVLKAEYAVRGAIAVKASEYQKALRDGAELPFSKVLQCNIGEPTNSFSFFNEWAAAED